MRIAVAGAHGFVGRHLTRFLSNQGINAVLIGRSDMAPESLGARLAGCDALVNCAGNKVGIGAAARLANIELPLRLLDAASTADIPVMIQVSSVAALTCKSAPGETVTDGHSYQPTSAYGTSKREGDELLLRVAREGEHKVALAILRPPILIGSDAGGVFGLLRSMARAGVPLPLAGLQNRRSVMHVGNVAAAVRAAARARCVGVFIVTDSPPLSSADLYMRMLAAAGYRRRIFPVGAGLRALLRKAMGVRGESLFGDAAYSGERFENVARVSWPIHAAEIVERAMKED